MRLAPLLLTVVGGLWATQALSQTEGTTTDPGRPRPLKYADLREDGPQVGTFREIWADALTQNNKSYEHQGDLRYVGGFAPATEAHYVIWTPSRSVVFSILNTTTFCKEYLERPDIGVRVKMCPMRVAFYEGGRKTVIGGMNVCYLEWTAPDLAKSDPYRSVAYASYDPKSKLLSTSLTVDHKPLEDCGYTIRLTSEVDAPAKP